MTEPPDVPSAVPPPEPPSAAAEPGDRPGGFVAKAVVGRWIRKRDVQIGALVGATSLILIAVVLRIWHVNWSIPLGYHGDGNSHNLLVKTIQENGGYMENPLLGYPHGLSYLDYPLGGDNLNLLLLRVLSWVTPDFAATGTIWILLTFPAVAIAAFIVMRRLGVSAWSAAACGVLYAFIYYHVRALSWILLIAYFALPFAILLAIRLMRGEALFARRPNTDGLRAWMSARNLATIATVVAIGSTGVYMAAFTLVLLAAGVALQLVMRRGRHALMGVLAMVGIVGMVAVNTSPSIINDLRNGPNDEAAQRQVIESDIYGLTLSRLVIPPVDHRFGPAARAGQAYQRNTALPASGEGIAYVGVVGLVGLAGLVLVALLGAAGGLGDTRRRRYAPLALCVAAAFLFATIGGGNSLFSYLVSPALRGLGRIVVVLTFCGLVTTAFLVDAVGRRARARGVPTVVLGVGLLALVGVGLYDQTGQPITSAWYADTQKKWDEDERFVSQIEATQPSGAPIYVFPEQPFPEFAGPGGMGDYDGVVGYLHSHNLRWSYGAMRGRDGVWLDRLRVTPIATKVPALARCGFSGIWFQRNGVEQSDAVTERLRVASKSTPLRSADGRFEFFDLRALDPPSPEAGREEPACRRMFRPPYIQSGDGLSPPTLAYPDVQRWLGSNGSLDIRNSLDEVRTVTMQLTLEAAQATTVVMSPAGTSPARFVVPAGGTHTMNVPLRLGPRLTTVPFFTRPASTPAIPAQTVLIRRAEFLELGSALDAAG